MSQEEHSLEKELQKEQTEKESMTSPMDTTVPSETNDAGEKTSLVSATLPQQQENLATINQLQLAHAALSGADDFPFLTNFENSMDVIAASDVPTNGTNTPASLHTLGQDPTTVQSPQSQQETSGQPTKQQNIQPTADLSQLPTELLKRELMNQKVRADNRERKKRWRQQNEERNKDNDLRCRVNKRAHKLFGKEDSEHKKKWIEEEFLKRQQKRKDKERRKGLVDDSLGGHAEGALNTNSGLDLAALAQHLAPQQSLTDASYLTLLCNNLGIPAAARNLLGTMNTTGHTVVENSESAVPPLSASPVEQDTLKDEKDPRLQPFPFQILELLQQLQHYQGSDTTSNNNNTNSGGESSTSHDFSLAPSYGHLGGIGERPEEKLVALLATTIQQAANVAAAAQVRDSLLNSEAGGTDTNMTGLSNHHGSDSSSKDIAIAPAAENTNDDTAQNNSNNAEFPMDAVLTLMQLNAGWRQ
ncbi:hypothetical protein EDC96DRAFT_513152 [Choanephora cucurbitarum]|nr:hypothetical protein EDC96DRAFT_513152 [Choanephora cucurbitarum]